MLFGWLLESVAGDWGLADLDWPVLDALAAHRAAPATSVAEVLRAASAPSMLLAAAALLAAVWAVWRRELWRPGLLLGASAADLLLVTGARHWVDRARPPAWFGAVGGPDGPAFPSAHASGTLTLLFAALYLAYARRESIRGLAARALGAVLLAGAVAASDVYLGRHWFTDIVASWSISAMVLAAVVWVDALRLRDARPDAAAAEVAGFRASADT